MSTLGIRLLMLSVLFAAACDDKPGDSPAHAPSSTPAAPTEVAAPAPAPANEISAHADLAKTGEVAPPPPTSDAQPTPAVVGCDAACAHRGECGVADAVAGCTRDCKQLVSLELLTDDGVGAYATAACDEVSRQEPEIEAAFTCLRGCRRALECKVPGELRTCLGLCASNLQKRVYDLATVKSLTAADCETIKAQVSLVPPAAAKRPSGASSSSSASPGRGCKTNGTQDCDSVWVCCRQGRVTRTGDGPGLCLSSGGCALAGMAR